MLTSQSFTLAAHSKLLLGPQPNSRGFSLCVLFLSPRTPIANNDVVDWFFQKELQKWGCVYPGQESKY